MIIEDRVYGKEEINEPVLVELINCKFVQRLKGISQHGMPSEYYHLPTFSRYDHSIGVLILLRRLGADLNEQVAGLLHDVSHTAFSHVVDWIVGDPIKEDYQDKIHLEKIKNSEVFGILDKHGFDFEKVADIESFSLLEQEAPILCADRVDYSLRELCLFGKKYISDNLLAHLISEKGLIVFDCLNSAREFANEYAKLQKEHWAGHQARARYYLLSNILEQGLNNNLFSLNDLQDKEDGDIINILCNSDDENILSGLSMLRNGIIVQDSDEENGILIKKKFRYVDPGVLIEGNVVNLSSKDSEHFDFIKNEKDKPVGCYVEIKPLGVENAN